VGELDATEAVIVGAAALLRVAFEELTEHQARKLSIVSV